MEELIVLVNESGKPVGSAPKLASHHADTPLHLAFSAYVFNAKGELLLTRRADSKKVFPGVWTNSCCGHPAPDEAIAATINRRLGHELGLRSKSIRLALPHYRYKATMNGVVENEICPVYIVGVVGEPRINLDEVAEYEWVTWSEFRRRIKRSPRSFSPWCKEQAKLLDTMFSSSAIESITRHRKSIEIEVSKLLAQKSTGTYNRWRVDVRSRLGSYLSGGKLLRGSLLLFSHEVFGGSNLISAKTAAASLELLHGALLTHDDIMDQDSTRRGKPAMHIQYVKSAPNAGDAERYGENMAICAADAAIFMAMGSLGTLKISDFQKTKLIHLFSEVCETVCYGQMLDIALGHDKKQPEKKDIEAVMEQKTAIYSLSLPLMAGAVLAGQPAAVINKLDELGKCVGTIFQIRDDELGVFGDTAKTGKPVGSDIKEGKKTLLQYYLFKKCSQSQTKRLLSIFGNHDAPEADITYVQHLMTELDVPEMINNDIAELTEKSIRIIDRLKIGDHHKETMYQLVAFCAKREV